MKNSITRVKNWLRRGLRAGCVMLAWSLYAPTLEAAGIRPKTRNLCDEAAQLAARGSDVPLFVLLAITRVETGQRAGNEIIPWPWTVNMEGKGYWLETAEAARALASQHHRRGAQNFDVGCFQINYKWHHKAFSSLEEMFDPLANATYAAKFLSQLYQELGSWEAAAGAYHSRTAEHAQRYKAKFAVQLESVKERAFRPSLPMMDGYRLPTGTRVPAGQSNRHLRTMGSLMRVEPHDGVTLFKPIRPFLEFQS